MRELAPRRSAPCLEFINTFARLRKVMIQKLRMTAEDERAAREKLAEVRAKEEECKARLAELETHLQRKRADHKRVLEVGGLAVVQRTSRTCTCFAACRRRSVRSSS